MTVVLRAYAGMQPRDHPTDTGINNYRLRQRQPDPPRGRWQATTCDARNRCSITTSRNYSTRSAPSSTRPLRPPKPARPPLTAGPQPAVQARPALARAGDGPAGPRKLHRATRRNDSQPSESPASTNIQHSDRPPRARLGLLLRHPRGQEQKRRRLGHAGRALCHEAVGKCGKSEIRGGGACSRNASA